MCSSCRRRHKLHKIVNVLAAMRKCAHTAVKKALAEIWNAEDRTHALAAVKQFNELFGAKFSNAVANITDDLDELPAFYDHPPSTGSICARRTRYGPSLPSGTAPRSPAGPDRKPPDWPSPSQLIIAG